MNACKRLSPCSGAASYPQEASFRRLHCIGRCRPPPKSVKSRPTADPSAENVLGDVSTQAPVHAGTPQTDQTPLLITAHSGRLAPQSQHVVDNASTAATRRNRAASLTPPGDDAGGGGGGVGGLSFISGDENERNSSPCFGRGAGDVDTVRRRKGLLDEGVPYTQRYWCRYFSRPSVFWSIGRRWPW